MPWVDADAWLAYWVRRNGPLPDMQNELVPLTFAGAAKLAWLTGGWRYEHQSDGTTRLWIVEPAWGAPP